MAQKANIVIDQGTTYSTTISVLDEENQDVDLSSHTGIAQIRKSFQSSNAVASFTVACSDGSVTLSMTANASANVAAGRYLYDVKLTDTSNNVIRIVEGIVTVNPQVSRT